ncbi:MAG: hypothetical protein M1510_14740 [Nitrospirae bacterium]|nr:hypothetical protein [Nitrospirota bacterium]MCL5236810.1 hypothetical protein [Nitrospirota bacterium]
MRSIIAFIAVLLAACILQFPEPGNASVALKDCETCHVLYPGMMGKEKGKDKSKDKITKDAMCVNCHTNTAEDTIKILGSFRTPIVYNTQEPNKPLAGGNFYYVAHMGERKGHNVNNISYSDMKFGGLPPGYERTLDPSSIGYNEHKPLACAGSNGCHGDRNIEDPFAAIMGSHHAIDTPVDGTTIAKSYRFLKITSISKGVVGLEDPDWGQNSSPTEHNEYSPSIIRLCESCHGEFHGKDKSKVWFRHPVGVVLPDRGEYKSYTAYSPEAPVARPDVPNLPGKEVKPGRDVVVCLTCHMAHGSPYNSSLRWNFETMIAGRRGKSGCFICHSKK